MLPAESENDALTDGLTYRQLDRQTEGRQTLEHNFLNGGYNINTLFKVAGYKNIDLLISQGCV